VLAFLPQIVILTVAMELLEASGYLARGAFLVDRLLRAAGLGGRAFVPLLTAHACAVPAIAATRIVRDPRERLTTMLVLPLMTCSARIPTYGLLIATFFAGRGPWFKALVFVGLYFAGVLAALIAALVLRRTVTRGRALPLVLEMPAYRAPDAAAVARVAGRSAWRFLRDVGTTILAASAVLWALLTVPLPGHAPATTAGAPAREVRLERSIAAGVGHALEPVTRPLGFDWRINVGLIGSFGARELMVGTLGVIFGIEDAGDDPAPLSARVRAARGPDGRPAYTAATGLALMAFFVLACQCMGTVAALRRETRGWRWPAFVLGYTYAAGYLAALLVYQGARLLGVA
jgi:ferrous iron transport protein B